MLRDMGDMSLNMGDMKSNMRDTARNMDGTIHHNMTRIDVNVDNRRVDFNNKEDMINCRGSLSTSRYDRSVNAGDNRGNMSDIGLNMTDIKGNMDNMRSNMVADMVDVPPQHRHKTATRRLDEYQDGCFIDALKVVPGRRTAQDLEVIYHWLRSMEALCWLREAALRSLATSVRYETHGANDILYCRGELATCWYILLRGSVFIDGSMFLPRSR
ncbi:uncharacterized protein LOC125178899 [Hyalella azteca]|uniref:Uncharacterized protein LOC125178899 n=1 Tax=Hyalella azteca TaxID=294128 RepID=A0A979FTC8_HYAAZ|nr:uncharacterized protein LOC125178899 [Hyalella azteca]